MKKLSPLNKVLYFINNVFALLLFLSIAIPYIKPISFPIISVLSLVVPFLIFAHIIFIIYWLINGLKRQFILSSICVILTILFSYFPYKFNGETLKSESALSIMTYNVHLFNRYNWIQTENIPNKISKFIIQIDPDIVTIQEYYKSKDIYLNFPYKYLELEGESNFGQAIYSKFEIINKGSLDFKNTSNNAIFIDIVKENDTIRIYNLHLESMHIKMDSLNLNEKNSKKLLNRISTSFVKQQLQVEQFIAHKEKCKFKTIICGDFNNTTYSWVYKNIKGDFKDSFLHAGKGFGKTFDFNKYPLRIDFILASEQFDVTEHRNYKVKFSDHEPILAKLDFKD